MTLWDQQWALWAKPKRLKVSFENFAEIHLIFFWKSVMFFCRNPFHFADIHLKILAEICLENLEKIRLEYFAQIRLTFFAEICFEKFAEICLEN